MVGHVFIGYSRADRAYVERLAEFLAEAGIPVWFDDELAWGDRCTRVIQEQIDAAVALLAVVTPASLEADWVQRELSYAFNRGKPVFPLQLEGGGGHILLASLLHEDVTGGQLPSRSFVERLRELVVAGPMRVDEPNEMPATAATGRSIHVLIGHTSWVGSVAWSPDGLHLATAGGDGTVRTWLAVSSKGVRTLRGHDREVWSVAWSPNGRRLASAGRDGTARLWDIGTGEAVRTLAGHDGEVWAVAWSPDGGRIVTAGADGTLRLYETRTGDRVSTFTGHAAAVRAVSWSPDGSRIASGSADRTAQIWDAKSGEVVTSLTGHGGAVASVAWSPDGARVATASADRTARTWDPASGQELIVLSGHIEAVNAVTWAPTTVHLATAGDDQTAQIWDVVDIVRAEDAPAAGRNRLLRTLPGHLGAVRAVDYSPNGRYLATASIDRTARIWANPPLR